MSPSKEKRKRPDRKPLPSDFDAGIRFIREPDPLLCPKMSPASEPDAGGKTGCPFHKMDTKTFPAQSPYYEGNSKPEADRILKAELDRYKAQVQALALELAKVEERELQRIASDLHDRIGQMLFAAKSKLERLAMKQSAAEVSGSVNETLDLVNQALLDTRELIVEISPPELYVFGLETALTSLLEQIGTDYGIQGTCRQTGRPLPFSETLNGVLYRATRELIYNVVKHAQAECIRVEIQYENDHVIIRIEDDGRGFQSSEPPAERAPKDGYGLFSLQERLGFMGGRLEFDATKDRGTRAIIVLPAGQVVRHEALL